MQTQIPSPVGPLSGVRVLDLTQFLSGPFGTQILGDLGAEIIKVEAPTGELSRTMPPYFVEGDSAYYLSINRNKKSVVIDLKTEQGVALVLDLAARSDVLIENNRPGVMTRLGLDWETVKRVNPRLVYCSISGFGQTGPDKDLPAYDMIVQAMSGGMSITGEIGEAPVRAGIPLSDLTAGMYGVIGVLAALHERQTSGTGKYVDIAMLDAQVAMLCYQGAYYLQSGVVPGPQGRGHDSIPTYRAFTCGDDVDVVITANTERMWSNLCGALGRPNLVDDERFRSNELRYANRKALWEILEACFRTKPSAAWVDDLVAAEVPAAVVNTLDRSLNDPQVLHRNMVLALTGPNGERARVGGNPIKFTGELEPDHHYPPMLGADNRLILSRLLGLTDERIDGLEREGAFGDKRKTLAVR